MKKSLLVILCIFSSLTFADETITPFVNAKNGINIVPLAELKIPAEMKNEIMADNKAHLVHGYRDTNDMDSNIIFLFKLQENYKGEIAKFDNDKNPYDTHLKSSVYKINLAFNFKGIPGILKENVLGYAAAGGYTKNKGWDGIVEFIADSKLGVCSYTTYKIIKVILDKETTEYLVNSKPSNESIAGNWSRGFLYTLSWYTPNRIMTLQCANKMYEPTNMDKMVALAEGIDRINFK